MAMEISSSAFQHQSDVPAEFTCDGPDGSPELSWKDVPEGAKSLVLICDDPDAPVGTWVHWVVYDIPATDTGMQAGIPKTPELPNGAKQGITDFRRVGYGGPCPPPGPQHRYFFKLYALDIMLNLPPSQTKAQVEGAMRGHIIGQAELVGHYGRSR